MAESYCIVCPLSTGIFPEILRSIPSTAPPDSQKPEEVLRGILSVLVDLQLPDAFRKAVVMHSKSSNLNVDQVMDACAAVYRLAFYERAAAVARDAAAIALTGLTGRRNA